MNTPRVRRAFVENFSDAPRTQDNPSKLLTALSAIATSSASTLQNLCTGKGAGARGGNGGERGQSFNKTAVNAVRETKIFNKRSLRS